MSDRIPESYLKFINKKTTNVLCICRYFQNGPLNHKCYQSLEQLQNDYPDATNLRDWCLKQKIEWWTQYINECSYLNDKKKKLLLKDVRNEWTAKVDYIYPSVDGELKGEINYRDKKYPLPDYFNCICHCNRNYKLCFECLITFLRNTEQFVFYDIDGRKFEGEINFQESKFDISWMSRKFLVLSQSESFQSIPIFNLILFID